MSRRCLGNTAGVIRASGANGEHTPKSFGGTVPAHRPYAPLNELKPFAHDVWIVDGPEIQMRYLGARIPFPTRMTVVRLPCGEIWLHLPTAFESELAHTISRLGPVRHLVAPSTLHYWHLPEWHAAFPAAQTYGPPGLRRRARRSLTVDTTLDQHAPPAWADVMQQCVVTGHIFTEIDFFHSPSRTLILTDLIENFEQNRVASPWLRLLLRLFGAAHPDGKAPLDMQLSFLGHRKQVRAAAEQMIAWEPARIILAHGRCYPEGGVEELRRAFRWVL